MRGQVFISYRRVQAAQLALRLKRQLRKRLKGTEVFFDQSSIPPGRDFFEHIEQRLALTNVMLVVMGPGWAELTGEDGEVRLNNPDDYVRTEVEIALERGITVIPVLINGAVMPEAGQLPESLQALPRLHAINIAAEPNDDDFDEMVGAITPHIPDRLAHWFHQFVAAPASFYLLPYCLISALTLFFAHVLGINFIEIGSDHGPKEVGFFSAINWLSMMFLISPFLLFAFQCVLREAAAFINDLKLRRLVVFVKPNGERVAASPEPVWETVVRRSSRFFAFMVLLTVPLCTFMWYQYSGQWPVEGFNRDAFNNVSTGVDWHVGWAIDDSLVNKSLGIKAFALLCYWFYSVGWSATFCLYIFLFTLMSELENLARGAGQHKAELLVLDVNDKAGGGFDRLRRIQHYHSLFTLASAVTMFLMATRNFFLPDECRVPDLAWSDAPALTAHCADTSGYFTTALQTFWQLITGTLSGADVDWSQMFFVYGDHNSFTLGPLYQVLLIGAFYFYISHKMRGIITASRTNTLRERDERNVASALMKTMDRRRWLTVTAVVCCGLAIVFQNFVILYVPATLLALRVLRP